MYKHMSAMGMPINAGNKVVMSETIMHSQRVDTTLLATTGEPVCSSMNSPIIIISSVK